LSRAERDGLVHRNVAALADPPRMTPREIVPFSPEQAATLVQGMQGHRLEPLWLLMLGTGMRHGEALALTWDDVDLEAGVVHVRRSLERWQGQWQLVELTKTLRSRRDLPVAGPVAAALTVQRDRQRWEAAKAGNEWCNAFNLVFTTETGGPLHESTVQHAFDRLLRELGLPKHRVYDLRHSAATFLLASGADLRSVMEQLGHSQIHLTANVYGHVLAERKQELAAIMGRLLEGLAATTEVR
jgi:integrase